MSTSESDGMLSYRLAAVEREQELQRQRIHDVIGDQNALRLMVQSNTDAIEYLGKAVDALRKAVIQVGVGITSAAIIFAISVLVVFGRP